MPGQDIDCQVYDRVDILNSDRGTEGFVFLVGLDQRWSNEGKWPASRSS